MNRIIKRLVSPKSIGEGDITSFEILTAYQGAFHMSSLSMLWAAFRGVFRFDNQYYKPADEELIQMILDADQGDKEEWILDWYDCGAFAFNLMGVFHQCRETAAMPIFICWVNIPEGGHAVLSYYKDGQVKIIEPQTDAIFNVPPTWKLTLLCG